MSSRRVIALVALLVEHEDREPLVGFLPASEPGIANIIRFNEYAECYARTDIDIARGSRMLLDETAETVT